MRRDAESGKAEKPKNRVLCTPPDQKSALKERGILACAPCVQAARVARAARESGAMHPALYRSAGTVRQLQRLPHAFSVQVVQYTFEPMGKPIGYNPARLQRAYLPMIGTERCYFSSSSSCVAEVKS